MMTPRISQVVIKMQAQKPYNSLIPIELIMKTLNYNSHVHADKLRDLRRNISALANAFHYVENIPWSTLAIVYLSVRSILSDKSFPEPESWALTFIALQELLDAGAITIPEILTDPYISKFLLKRVIDFFLPAYFPTMASQTITIPEVQIREPRFYSEIAGERRHDMYRQAYVDDKQRQIEYDDVDDFGSDDSCVIC